jgi:hypothetical protein
MALLDNPHAMYPYHLMNSRLAAAAMGSTGNDLNSVQHSVNQMNGYMNGRFDMRIGSTSMGPNSQSSSSNRSSTSPINPSSRQNLDILPEEESSPTHQTVLNATMSLKLESANYHHRVGHFASNRSTTTFRPFSSESPDLESNLSDETRRDLKVMIELKVSFQKKVENHLFRSL